MLHAKIVSGGKKDERLGVINKLVREALGVNLSQGHPDLILISGENSIGIQQIRQVEKKLALKPYSAPVKIAVIWEAEKLTIPAQNSLLKTLEEPPAHSLIILSIFQKSSLLPTILSRCQAINLPSVSQIETTAQEAKTAILVLQEILQGSPGKRLSKLEAMGFSSEEATTFTQSLLSVWHSLLEAKIGRGEPLPQLSYLGYNQIKQGLVTTTKALKILEANVNPKLVLGNLFLSYPHIQARKRA
jgi:hypothetical protein